jgi:uncharacterized protein (TIGR02452 family)
VHLSAESATAKRVGGRRGEPVVLVVRAAEMAAAGHAFFRSENGVWLVEHVPPAFIEIDASRAPRDAGRPSRTAIARETLAACDARAYTNGQGARVALEFDPAATVFHDTPPAWTSRSARTHIELTGESTLAAIARLGDGVACLNFASAKHPGGGFLGGAQAQEETLARSSALYPCIVEQRRFYEHRHASALYADLALWTPRVPFFRTDDGAWLDAPVYAGVITSAAPNAGALRQHGRFDAAEVARALHRRAELVLAVAAHHGVSRLVLGAWGAGVFGNDPAVVARAFADHLRGPFAGAFDEILFAIPAGPNHDAFAAVF